MQYFLLLDLKKNWDINDNKFEAMQASNKHSGGSIMTSALSFFSATIGVGVISQLELIGSLCTMSVGNG